jgi:uncharacterized protein YjbI with pentapeptide repeats
MTKLGSLIIGLSVVLVVVVGGISWFAFASGNDMGEGAISAKSVDEAKVPVSVVLSSDARRLNVTIDWHDELDALRGDDRFNARVKAGGKEIELKQWEDTRPDVDQFTLEFTEAEATLLLAAVDNGDAVVAITQQSDTDLDSDSLYEANYATVVRIQAAAESALPVDVAVRPISQLTFLQVTTANAESALGRDYRDCSNVSIAPKAALRFCDLSYANLHRVDLANADLSYANLIRADLSAADLSAADLSFGHLYQANLSSANLSKTNAGHAELTRANLTDANLSDAEIKFGFLTSADMQGANLSGASLIHADLIRADLYEANLTRADLNFANLSNAEMSYSNLSYANLSLAILSGTSLHSANLTGTKCPSGYVATGTPPTC